MKELEHFQMYTTTGGVGLLFSLDEILMWV
jgi:hypothetical protein